MPYYFHEKGRTHTEILDKIRRKYGNNFRILTQKQVPASGLLGFFGKEEIEYSGYIAVGKETREVQNKRDFENKKGILASVGVDMPPVQDNDSPEEKSSQLKEVLRELQDIKGQLSTVSYAAPAEPFPILTELQDILRKNDFEDVWIQKMMENLRVQLSAIDLENRKKIHLATAQAVISSLNFSITEDKPPSQVLVLVGPTGVGKTTTIAKLAAIYGLSDKSKKDVRIITVDSFRIGARAQVETYGKIMEIPVLAVDDFMQLKTQIALASDADLVLVDTIGKNPRDTEDIHKMQKLLEACGSSASVHLALSATTKTPDLRIIMEQFQPFNYDSVLITKIDETSVLGNLISILSEYNVPVSYLTNGQSVPFDITIASPERFLERIKDLDIDSKIFNKIHPAVDTTASWR